MIRDRSSEKEHKNVPDLEPEEDSVLREEEPAEEHIPEEKITGTGRGGCSGN